jgi:outer membrane murein-binding lipoprotein Lpp
MAELTAQVAELSARVEALAAELAADRISRARMLRAALDSLEPDRD